MISLGNIDIKKISLGSNEISKVNLGNVEVFSSLKTWEKYDTKSVMYASRGGFISSHDSYLLNNNNHHRAVIDDETGRLGEPITPSQVKKDMRVILMRDSYSRWFYIRSTGTYYNGGIGYVGYTFSANQYETTITTSEEKNNLIETVHAEEGTYPTNGRHTDGYWYVLVG